MSNDTCGLGAGGAATSLAFGIFGVVFVGVEFLAIAYFASRYKVANLEQKERVRARASTGCCFLSILVCLLISLLGTLGYCAANWPYTYTLDLSQTNAQIGLAGMILAALAFVAGALACMGVLFVVPID
jgi:hypothetical protein